MKIIEIKALDNGAHDNQEIYGVNSLVFPVPKGWAVIPESMSIPETFPFVSIETREIDDIMTVTHMVASAVPEPEPSPEPSPTLEERVGTLEQSKADQADVDELHEALDMILTGVTA